MFIYFSSLLLSKLYFGSRKLPDHFTLLAGIIHSVPLLETEKVLNMIDYHTNDKTIPNQSLLFCCFMTKSERVTTTLQNMRSSSFFFRPVFLFFECQRICRTSYKLASSMVQTTKLKENVVYIYILISNELWRSRSITIDYKVRK